jgi:glycine cleavage system transcriptional repressor
VEEFPKNLTEFSHEGVIALLASYNSRQTIAFVFRGVFMKTKHEFAYVLDVMSCDHPGIVASVGSAVGDRDGNIDAISQTVLEGYFTLIMVVSFPKEMTPADFCTTITDANPDLQVMMRRYDPAEVSDIGDRTERFVITAFGKDRPGVVLHFSRYLAGKDINIIDLYGDRKGDEEFLLIGQVEIPPGLEIGHLQAELEEMGRQEEYTVRLQHENIFVATNQLRMGGSV